MAHIEIEGQSCKLQLSLACMKEIEEAFQLENFFDIIRILSTPSATQLQKLLQIILRHSGHDNIPNFDAIPMSVLIKSIYALLKEEMADINMSVTDA